MTKIIICFGGVGFPMDEGEGAEPKAKHMPFAIHINFVEICQAEKMFCNSTFE